MATFKVFHKTDSSFEEGEAKSFPKGYELVSTLKAKDLEEVFCLTNHVDRAWHLRDLDWLFLRAGDHRSTSVGDVVEEDGTPMVVGKFCWLSLAEL
jgi:hypothetical protein